MASVLPQLFFSSDSSQASVAAAWFMVMMAGFSGWIPLYVPAFAAIIGQWFCIEFGGKFSQA
jgi:hypothetical protein